jgi:hypothetical protein
MNVLYFIYNYRIKIPKHIKTSLPWFLATKMMLTSYVLAVKWQKSHHIRMCDIWMRAKWDISYFLISRNKFSLP